MTVSVCSSESFNRPTGPEGTGVAETSDSPLARFFFRMTKTLRVFYPGSEVTQPRTGWKSCSCSSLRFKSSYSYCCCWCGSEQLNQEERKSKYLKIHSSKRSEGKIHWYLYYRILVLAWQHGGNCGCLLRVRYLLPTVFSLQEPSVIEKFFFWADHS